MQQFGGDCKLRTPLCSRRGARACQPRGGRRDGPPGGAPLCAARCPGGLPLVRPPLSGPTDPNPPGSTVASAMSLPRGGTAAGTGIPPGWLRGRSCAPSGREGRASKRASALPARSPGPGLRAASRSAPRFGRCAGFSLALEATCLGSAGRGGGSRSPPAPSAPPGEIPRRGLDLTNFGGGSWQRCRAPAPSCQLVPGPNNARFDAR